MQLFKFSNLTVNTFEKEYLLFLKGVALMNKPVHGKDMASELKGKTKNDIISRFEKYFSTLTDGALRTWKMQIGKYVKQFRTPRNA